MVVFALYFQQFGPALNFCELKNQHCFMRSPDVYIDVPDVIDITNMRSKGLQSGEELLPETGLDF